jgi:adenine-specific DNA methylase
MALLTSVGHDEPRDATATFDQFNIPSGPVFGVHFNELSSSQKDIAFYERELTRAFAESRRVLRPDGIGTIVFASKTTASWEAILQAVLHAGWTITASWPIDTEREARVSALEQARLASSIHLVC